jgi:hypothetical protein
MSEQNLQRRIIAKAMKDEVFRQELLSHPKEVLERELDITFPMAVTIHVHEETPFTVHLVLPLQPLTAVHWPEVSDAELAQAANADNTKSGNTCEITACRSTCSSESTCPGSTDCGYTCSDTAQCH